MSWSASREAQSSCVWSGQHKHSRSRLLESPTPTPLVIMAIHALYQSHPSLWQVHRRLSPMFGW